MTTPAVDPSKPTWVLLGPTTAEAVGEASYHALRGGGITDWPALLEELPTPTTKAEARTYAAVALLAARSLP